MVAFRFLAVLVMAAIRRVMASGAAMNAAGAASAPAAQQVAQRLQTAANIFKGLLNNRATLVDTFNALRSFGEFELKLLEDGHVAMIFTATVGQRTAATQMYIFANSKPVDLAAFLNRCVALLKGGKTVVGPYPYNNLVALANKLVRDYGLRGGR